MKRRALVMLCALILGLGGPLAAATPFEEGERLYRENRPADALPFLELAAGEAGADERAWLYLGVAYQQLGRLDKAASAFRKGLESSATLRDHYYFNLGNVLMLQGKNVFAIDMYGEALKANNANGGAYLCRANARMSTKDLEGACSDYKSYLGLVPNSPQRPVIEALVRRIEAGMAEAARLAAEAEARRIAEEAARKALLEQAAASLKAAAEDRKNLSSEGGNVQGYDDDLGLED